MRPLWKDILTAAFMGMILPGVLLNFAVMLRERQEAKPVPTVSPETVPQTVALPMYLRQENGTVVERDMDEYLVEVLLAEMPADFEMEALKAQAVAARTYTQKAYQTGGKHGDGSVCTEPSCCQAWLTTDAYLSQGGTEEGLEKITRAVQATSGQVLTYDGTLIEATYFSCSGGSTEDAAAVWGVDFPYLQAVDSPGEEKAVYYTDTVTFTPEAFQTALGRSLPGSPESWFGDVSYTGGGGIAAMTIGGESYSGTQLRSLLGLRSTAFTVDTEESQITITTKGYGHRVGMSQYGADAMAVQGKTYEEILGHYYPGTEIATLK